MKIRRLKKTLAASIIDEILVVDYIGSMLVISQRGLSEGMPSEITDRYHWKEIPIGDSGESDSVGSLNIISSLDPWMFHWMLVTDSWPCDCNHIEYSGLSP